MSTIETIGSAASPETRPAGSKWLPSLLNALLWVETVVDRSRSRRALSALNDEQLKDIGLSRSQAFREASRPFWE